MKKDTNGAWRWTALLPDGKRVRLNVAEGVRLCVGDVLWIGGSLYSVAKRQMDGRRAAWNVVVRPGSEQPAAPSRAKSPRLAT